MPTDRGLPGIPRRPETNRYSPKKWDKTSKLASYTERSCRSSNDSLGEQGSGVGTEEEEVSIRREATRLSPSSVKRSPSFTGRISVLLPLLWYSNRPRRGSYYMQDDEPQMICLPDATLEITFPLSRDRKLRMVSHPTIPHGRHGASLISAKSVLLCRLRGHSTSVRISAPFWPLIGSTPPWSRGTNPIETSWSVRGWPHVASPILFSE